MITVYDEFDIGQIIARCVAAYEIDPEEYNWWYDPAKETVIIKLYIEEEPENDNPNR